MVSGGTLLSWNQVPIKFKKSIINFKIYIQAHCHPQFTSTETVGRGSKKIKILKKIALHRFFVIEAVV